MNENIQNYDTYNSRMNKSMIDKLFFLDKIDISDNMPRTFIDYGCANGILIKNLAQYMNDDINFIGYDTDDEMIKEANESIKNSKASFSSDWDTVQSMAKEKFSIILSSIIHEIYHYSKPSEINDFWKRIFENKVEYIIIRDMCPSLTVDRQSDINDVSKVYNKFFGTRELNDFQTIWGSIENNKNLIHFLLKYQYTKPNWYREVKENYIPLYKENLLAMIPTQKYQIVYYEHYTLPYIKQKVMNDFGIEIKDPTHIKIILKRNN